MKILFKVLSITILMLMLTACPEPPDTDDITVTVSAVQGIQPPVSGNTPVTAITETEQYSGSVTWAPADVPFNPETAYTATVTLTAKEGYTFTGVVADFFTVAGAVTSNQSDSGVITAEFPETASSTSPLSAGDKEAYSIDNVSFNLVYVPAGKTFTMGEPVILTTQDVTLSKSFLLAETEVTQALWESVRAGWPGSTPVPDGDNYPAYYLNWYDAVAFCNELTLADDSIADAEIVYYSDESLTNAYTSGISIFADWTKKGYRLPTEAEWEYAARWIDGTDWNPGNHISGDTTDPYNQSSVLGNYAWYDGNSATAREVGTTSMANALGLYDMSGNVREWCFDWQDDYSGGSVTDPKGSDTGSQKILRGGSFIADAFNITTVVRFIEEPSDRTSQFSTTYYGFRLCRTAD